MGSPSERNGLPVVSVSVVGLLVDVEVTRFSAFDQTGIDHLVNLSAGIGEGDIQLIGHTALCLKGSVNAVGRCSGIFRLQIP